MTPAARAHLNHRCATYFVSDLHLSEQAPELTTLFLRFLAEHGPNMRGLYVLGDFFDAWIGDDDSRALIELIANALRTLAQSGTDIFLMHGNRDFLLGAAFAERCGASLIPEFAQFELRIPAVGEPEANQRRLRVQLCHGDQFCTQDVAYQAFRRTVRDPAWQQQFLAQPLQARIAFAAAARAQSKVHQRAAETIGDVAPETIRDFFTDSGSAQLLHGHTHRPGLHRQEWQNSVRIVLGDWRAAQPSWLKIADDGTAELVAHGKQECLNLT